MFNGFHRRSSLRRPWFAKSTLPESHALSKFLYYFNTFTYPCQPVKGEGVLARRTSEFFEGGR